jgi:ankyrin repeat protein
VLGTMFFVFNGIQMLKEAVAALLSVGDGKLAGLSDAFGRTALHYAAALGKKSAMQALLSSSFCDVNSKDKAGNTALHLCCLADCAELLLQHGANVNEPNLVCLLNVLFVFFSPFLEKKKQIPLTVASQFGLLELRSCYFGWGAKGKPAVNLVPPKKFKIQIKMSESDPYEDGLVLE